MKFRALLWIVIAGLIAGGATWWSWWWRGRIERSQDAPIREAASRYGVEPSLVKAIVWRESKFNPSARGRAQEIGLMQLREEAAQEWAEAERIETFQHEHCLDPRTNTLAGTYYLRKLLNRYRRTDNPLPYALADYNAGRANVLKWLRTSPPAATNSLVFIEQIGFPGTKQYVRSVIRRQAYYSSMIGRLRGDAGFDNQAGRPTFSRARHCQNQYRYRPGPRLRPALGFPASGGLDRHDRELLAGCEPLPSDRHDF